MDGAGKTWTMLWTIFEFPGKPWTPSIIPGWRLVIPGRRYSNTWMMFWTVLVNAGPFTSGKTSTRFIRPWTLSKKSWTILK